MEEKLALIAEALDAEKELIKQQVALEELEEWDSMGIIAVISMLDKKYKVQLKADQIKALKTVNDILTYMQ
ncbi:acyl carrier protein [Aminivibrio sp.]|jgi:acyl carrier protein|uniref:acyl carrier protein n=1 Tax=Aminivibrio sp. TaxID=1872489 RepID=UPI003D9912A6